MRFVVRFVVLVVPCTILVGMLSVVRAPSGNAQLAVGRGAVEQFRVVRYPLLQLRSNGPATNRGVVAVNGRGFIAFSEPRDSDGRVVRVVDSTGRLIRDFGTAGPGADHVGRVGLMFFRDSIVAVYADSRLIWFNLDGTTRAGQAFGPTEAPMATFGDSIDVIDVARFITGRGPVTVDRFPRGGGPPRRLLTELNQRYRTLVRSTEDSTRFVLPAYGTNGKTIVVGNGYTYRLSTFSRDARGGTEFGRRLGPRAILPSERQRVRDSALAAMRGVIGPDGARHGRSIDARQLDSLLSRPREHFTGRIPSIAIDDAERIWVIGTTSNSTFVDLFEQSTFLQRIEVPCRPTARGAAISPPWVALACLTPASASQPSFPSLQLFRIIEGTHGGRNNDASPK